MNRQQFNAMVAQYGEVGMGALFGESLEWSGGAHCDLPSLVFKGGCKQYGTPTPDSPIDIYDHIGVYQVNSSQDYIRLPNLRGVDSYRDEWDYVTGKGIRRVHKVVFDGKSTYRKFTTFTPQSNGVILCGLALQYKTPTTGGSVFRSSHFRGRWDISPGCTYTTNQTTVLMFFEPNRFPDIASANAWLAEQYANGTPVTVYYALAEPIPFEERPQPYVPIPNDSGNISFVDGNVSGAPFELTYITHS